MYGFYKAIKNRDMMQEMMAVTAVEADGTTEHALLAGPDRTVIYEEGDFLPAHTDAFKQLTGYGMQEMAGRKVFYEQLEGQKKIVICGAGHVGLQLLRQGILCGYHTIVLEDRDFLAEEARKLGADEVICDSFENGLKKIPGDHDTWFVIMTRGHAFDGYCLEQVLRKPHAYVGMMGSRRKIAMIRSNLVKAGFGEDIMDSIHMPIGLDLAAETPAEIAVSVMAEIILDHNKRKSGYGYPGSILDLLCPEGSSVKKTDIKDLIHDTTISAMTVKKAAEDAAGQQAEAGDIIKIAKKQGAQKDTAEWQERTVSQGERPDRPPMVLVTILQKKGSAPRESGTKMLVLYGGRIVGTIGGGSVEAKAVQIAREMIADQKANRIEDGKRKSRIITVDNSYDGGGEEESCKGVLELLLEVV